jgi:hypothetical protein
VRRKCVPSLHRVVFLYRSVFSADGARNSVRHGLEAGGRYFLAAVFADAVQTKRQSSQCLIDSLNFLTGGFSDSLEGLIVLDLDGAVA